jgi:hypothetical protein
MRPRPRPPGRRCRPRVCRRLATGRRPPRWDATPDRSGSSRLRPTASSSRPVAERRAGRILRLGDAVGVEVQAVARPQADRPLLVVVGGQPDHGALAREDHRTGAGRQVNRAGVPGGGVPELPGRGVQDAVHQCGELAVHPGEREQPVQGARDRRRRGDLDGPPAPFPRTRIEDGPTATGGGRASPTAAPPRRRGPLTSRTYSATLRRPSGTTFSPSPPSSSHGRYSPGELRARTRGASRGEERLLDRAAAFRSRDIRPFTSASRALAASRSTWRRRIFRCVSTRACSSRHLERLGDVVHPAGGERLTLSSGSVRALMKMTGMPAERRGRP